MHPRGIGTVAAVVSEVLLYWAFAAYVRLPLCAAQQPVSSPHASLGTRLPADVQAKLNRLQDELNAARATGDAQVEAKALNQVSGVYLYTSDFKKALAGYNEALAMARTGKYALEEAAALNGIGDCDLSMSENNKAMEAYKQALVVSTASSDLHGQAAALSGLGWVSNWMGQNQEALDFYNRALPLARSSFDFDVEARVLRRTGLVYYVLGDMQKALEYYNQALPLFRKIHDPYREATVLNDLGLVYSDMDKKQKALGCYRKALQSFQRSGDRESEALTWKAIGKVYGDLGKRQAELEYYSKALPIIHQVGDLDNEASTLDGIGRAYSILGKTEQAQEYFTQALPLANTANDPLLEADILENMMRNQSSLQPSLAIFYGKQAVNCLQRMRTDIQKLDKELQKSFLTSKEDYYRELADLLINQDRLPEAEQVLDLLKQQEYTDYVRGNPTKMLSPLTLTPAEKQAEEDYQRSIAQIVSLSNQWAELKKIPGSSRTLEQQQQLQKTSDELEKANQGLSDFYLRLNKLLGSNSYAGSKVAAVKGDVAVLTDQIKRTPHAVGLRTVVGENTYSVIVLTGTVALARQYAIKRAELNKKILEFKQLLRDPSTDPRPIAEELYKILLGPVQADLDQAQAQTLIWTLDGDLRYIPMAALYDGNDYLIKKYNMAAVTMTSYSHLDDQRQLANVSVVAMGISRKYEDDLAPLPMVTTELDNIVKDPRVQGADGVLPGSILLNGQFTERAMKDLLDGQNAHAIVHIASHFVLNPGDDNASYLLLAGKDAEGSGYHLTIARFRDDPNLSLEGTDLLTLSGCETGVGSTEGDGKEVDGLGTTAQLKGAKAVISSLWEVSDASTGDLMADFYKRWAGGDGKEMKVEALRQAQLDLLEGKIKPVPDYSNPNAPTSFAHPYFWAPFILIGNWR
jgi:CHAT domain-containing protein/predicted negative regulator of RcsB-dependent stress response